MNYEHKLELEDMKRTLIWMWVDLGISNLVSRIYSELLQNLKWFVNYCNTYNESKMRGDTLFSNLDFHITLAVLSLIHLLMFLDSFLEDYLVNHCKRT